MALNPSKNVLAQELINNFKSEIFSRCKHGWFLEADHYYIAYIYMHNMYVHNIDRHASLILLFLVCMSFIPAYVYSEGMIITGHEEGMGWWG